MRSEIPDSDPDALVIASDRRRSTRFRVDPGDVPADKAARRLHLTKERFIELLPELMQRGFPRPDPTTEMFDLEAIDRWRHRRHPELFPEISDLHEAMDGSVARQQIDERIARMRSEPLYHRGRRKQPRTA